MGCWGARRDELIKDLQLNYYTHCNSLKIMTVLQWPILPDNKLLPGSPFPIAISISFHFNV